LHNYDVTGSFTTLPYMLDQKFYGVPQGLLWQKLIEEPPLQFAELKETYSWQRSMAEISPAGRFTYIVYLASWWFFDNGWYVLPFGLSLLLWRDPRVAVGAGMV